MLHGCAFPDCTTFTLSTYCVEHELLIRVMKETERAHAAHPLEVVAEETERAHATHPLEVVADAALAATADDAPEPAAF